MNVDQITTWLTEHGPGLLVGAVILFVLFRLAKPVIHRVVVRLLQVQQSSLPAGSAPAEELAKRATTLEELFGKLVRGLLVFAIFGLILSAFDLWPLLAGLGLLAAALTLAGQDIVLDYLMGTLILIEGHYYKGAGSRSAARSARWRARSRTSACARRRSATPRAPFTTSPTA